MKQSRDIDDVPALNAGAGEASLDRIDTNSVERIEVLKGPASVLCGTNAYSGAANIVPRRDSGAGVSSQASVAAKRNGYFRGGAGNDRKVWEASGPLQVGYSLRRFTHEQSTLDVNLGYRHKLGGKTVRHALTLKNLTDSEMAATEYVRHSRINDIPLGTGRRVAYEIDMEL